MLFLNNARTAPCLFLGCRRDFNLCAAQTFFSLFQTGHCSVYACCVLVNVYLLHPLNPWMLVFILFTHQYYLSMWAIRVAFRCLYVGVLKCALRRVRSALGNRLGSCLLLPRIKVSAALITSLPASAALTVSSLHFQHREIQHYRSFT